MAASEISDQAALPPPGEAHLWCLDPARFEGAAAAQHWLARLPADERLRFEAYRAPSARNQYLATRALVRTVLSRYSGVAIESLRFAASAAGRPELTLPEIPTLRFSLSNTNGLVVGLFADGREVGVDAEEIAPLDVSELAERFFAPAEAAELRALTERECLRRFCEMWTLKESYLKARGLGVFALPLDQISFSRMAADRPSPLFGSEIADDPGAWQFDLLRMTAAHVVATCLGRQGGEARIVVRRLEAEEIL